MTGRSAESPPHPVRPASPSKGLARAFRRARVRHDRYRDLLVAGLVMVTVLGGGAYFLPGSSWEGSEQATSSSSNGGNLSVSLGSPIVLTTTCTDGQTTPVELVPWMSASEPVSTSEIHLELVELIDGDIDGGPISPPAVTSTYLCGQPLVSAWASWYVVLQNPGAANVAYFSYSQGWVNLASPGTAITIAAGSSLIMVSTRSFAHLSFGLCVLGNADLPALDTCAQL